MTKNRYLMECKVSIHCVIKGIVNDQRLFSKGGSACDNCHSKYCYVFPSNRCLPKSLIAFQNFLLYHPKMFLMVLKLHHRRSQNSIDLQNAKISNGGKRRGFLIQTQWRRVTSLATFCFLWRYESLIFLSQSF